MSFEVAEPRGPRSFSLDRIATALSGSVRRYGPAAWFHRVVVDSREVRPGDLFVAVRGVSVDAHRFVPAAFAGGAAAVVVDDPDTIPSGRAGIVVADTRRALAEIAAILEGYPSHHLTLIGVTGTDGKTTTSSIIAAILEAASLRTGLVSTVHAQIGTAHYDTGPHTTTPDAIAVQRFLREMVDAGCTHAVLETTSHAIDQERVHACAFDVAVVTNVTPEHLDYHGTFDTYRATKRRLFTNLAGSYRKPGVPKLAVVNADEPACADFADVAADRILLYGLTRQAAVRAERIELTPSAIRMVAITPDWEQPIVVPLPGRYNVANSLAAIAVGVGLGIPAATIREAIEGFRGIVGRMERIECGQPFSVIIDFAHTPNSLSAALRSARPAHGGRLTVVFGCAGLRDRAKRPVMGEIAGQLADRIVVTAEDPRTEDVEAIMEQIAVGLERAGRQRGRDYWLIADRDEAIGFAIRSAEPDDVVIITGKGHERTMCFGTVEHPWSDQEVARRHLAAISGHAARAGGP